MARRMRKEAMNAYGNITLVSGSSGNSLGVFWEFFWEFSRNILGVFWEYFGSIWEYFGNFQDNSGRECTGVNREF